MENGNFYEQNWHTAKGLFEVVSPRDSSNNTFICNPTINIAAEYEFQVTVQSPLANRSIAICGLLYQSVSETTFTQHCYTDRVAWITYKRQDNVTSTSDVPFIMSTIIGDKQCTSTLQPTTAKPTVGGSIHIPGEASLAVIVIAAVISFVAGVLIVLVIILCKKR